MQLKELIKEIKKLPVSERMYIIEEAIHSIRDQEEKRQMLDAAEELAADYGNDRELTSFRDLDIEDFYEAK